MIDNSIKVCIEKCAYVSTEISEQRNLIIYTICKGTQTRSDSLTKWCLSMKDTDSRTFHQRFTLSSGQVDFFLAGRSAKIE